MDSVDAGAGNPKDGNTSENESLRGYASERSDWARERLGNLLGTVRGGDNKSLDDTMDPVFMGGNISDSMRSSTNRTARTARTTRETRDTTRSSQRESSIAPSVARSIVSLDPVFMGGVEEASKSSIFRDENGRPRNVSKKKFFCIGILVFLIVDAILLGVFLGPRLIKGKSSSILGPGNGDNDDANDQNFPDGFIPPTDDFDSPTDDADSMEDDLAFTRHPDSTEPPVVSPTEPPVVSPTEPPVEPPMEESGLTQTKLGRYEKVDSVPHDGDAFTQGLEILSSEKIKILNKLQSGENFKINGTPPGTYAVESTGQYGRSTLRIVEVATGNVVQTLDLEEEYFGEGCTYFLNGETGQLRVVQLTWKENRGFVYRLKLPDTSATSTDTQWELKRIGNFTYGDQTTSTNGWGIVYHPYLDQFIVTDGTRWLHFWKLTEKKIKNPDGSRYFTFSMDLVKKEKVRESRSTPSNWTVVTQVNEMEWDPYSYGGNTILANKWKSNEIIRIWVGPDDYKVDNNYENIFLTASNSIDVGKITHVYDLSRLEALANPVRPEAVLNGIAFVYDTESTANEFWVTGKLWPTMYRVRMIDD
jgi:glutamine cyclotransferase